jgi:hypothetical protein
MAPWSLPAQKIPYSSGQNENLVKNIVWHKWAFPAVVRILGFCDALALVRKSEAEKELVAAARAVLNDKLFFPSLASCALRVDSARNRSPGNLA